MTIDYNFNSYYRLKIMAKTFYWPRLNKTQKHRFSTKKKLFAMAKKAMANVLTIIADITANNRCMVVVNGYLLRLFYD